MESSSLIPLDVEVEYERSTSTMLCVYLHEIVSLEIDLVKRVITKAHAKAISKMQSKN